MENVESVWSPIDALLNTAAVWLVVEKLGLADLSCPLRMLLWKLMVNSK